MINFVIVYSNMSNANNQLNIKHIYSNDILQEINSSVINELKSHLRGSQCLVACCFIDNFIRWLSLPFYKFDEDEYWSDAAEVKIYCPEGNINYGIIVSTAEYKDGRLFVMLYCADESNYFVMKDVLMVTRVLNWTRSLTFEGVQEGFISMLEDVISLKNTSVMCKYEKKLLVMPETSALQVKLEYPPPDIFIGRLELKRSHIKLVNNNWDEKTEHSDFLVETLIRNNRGAAIYLRNDSKLPICWALQQHYGGIGMVNITQSNKTYGNREFLQILLKFMIRYYTIDENVPFTCLSKEHVHLINVFVEAGFRYVSNLFWITTRGVTGYKYVSYFQKAQIN
ncbi:uncharacterized protein LOC124362148 isoform X3 [Homalodisca vitripennis]|uniref:uncharacterized protein LOC124362148 isoform X3 n=1 Tax=Homalodisca vitripennis TaxID=197043 RepID=UPI001EEA6178|nr:uncharacterized protein LOC124362148 isoform X3 [Homalodisca vitripennis]